MTQTYKRPVLILIALLFTSAASFSQIPGFFGRFQMGYSTSTLYTTYEGNAQSYDSASMAYKNVKVKDKRSTKFGVGFTMDEFIPLTQLGRKSELALNIGLMSNIYSFSNISFIKIGDDVVPNPTYDFSGIAGQFGMPLGLDFKFGCDAFCVKNYRWCATLGAGAYPNLNVTAFPDNAGGGFGVVPYIKAEGGIRWGLCWKLRTTVTFGNIDLINKNNSVVKVSGQPGDFTLTQNASITFSLIIMPFAPWWKRTGFWDNTL